MPHGARQIGDLRITAPFLDAGARRRTPDWTIVLYDRKRQVSEYKRFRDADEAWDFYEQVLDHGKRPEGG